MQGGRGGGFRDVFAEALNRHMLVNVSQLALVYTLDRDPSAGWRELRLIVEVMAWYYLENRRTLEMAVVVASRLTRKYQATIPAEVRKALRLKQGDTVRFEVAGTRVTLRRQTAADRAYLRGLEKSLSEWSSAFDNEAYADL